MGVGVEGGEAKLLLQGGRREGGREGGRRYNAPAALGIGGIYG